MLDRTQEFQGLLKLFGVTDLPIEEEQDLMMMPGEGGENGSSSNQHQKLPTPSSDFAAAAHTVAKGFVSTLRYVRRYIHIHIYIQALH